MSLTHNCIRHTITRQSLHVSSSTHGDAPAPSQPSYYEACLRPDPVYGLGMRLEKREQDILVASFKVGGCVYVYIWMDGWMD